MPDTSVDVRMASRSHSPDLQDVQLGYPADILDAQDMMEQDSEPTEAAVQPTENSVGVVEANETEASGDEESVRELLLSTRTSPDPLVRFQRHYRSGPCSQAVEYRTLCRSSLVKSDVGAAATFAGLFLAVLRPPPAQRSTAIHLL